MLYSIVFLILLFCALRCDSPGGSAPRKWSDSSKPLSTRVCSRGSGRRHSGTWDRRRSCQRGLSMNRSNRNPLHQRTISQMAKSLNQKLKKWLIVGWILLKRIDMMRTRKANHHNNIKNKGCHYNSNYRVDEVRISDNITSKLERVW